MSGAPSGSSGSSNIHGSNSSDRPSLKLKTKSFNSMAGGGSSGDLPAKFSNLMRLSSSSSRRSSIDGSEENKNPFITSSSSSSTHIAAGPSRTASSTSHASTSRPQFFARPPSRTNSTRRLAPSSTPTQISRSATPVDDEDDPALSIPISIKRSVTQSLVKSFSPPNLSSIVNWLSPSRRHSDGANEGGSPLTRRATALGKMKEKNVGEFDWIEGDMEERSEIEDEGYFEAQNLSKPFDILMTLPSEVALDIIAYLPLDDIFNCFLVCKDWKNFFDTNSIWKRLFYLHPSWHLLPQYQQAVMASNTSSPGPQKLLVWKDIYKKRASLDKRWGRDGHQYCLEGHTDSVYCLQYDSQKLITGSRDRQIKIWSLRTSKLLATIPSAHTASVLCLAFDEQTGFMVSGGSDSEINVWDLGLLSNLDTFTPSDQGEPTVRRVATLRGHRQGVLDIGFNEKFIVSCSKDFTIRVWSRETFELVHELVGHRGPVNAIGICNGKLASASGDSKIRIWDLESGRQERVLEGHERGLACVEFKGDYIVSGSNDKTLRVWKASTGECLRQLKGHKDLVRTLTFSPEMGLIVSGGYDKKIIIWDLHTGKKVDQQLDPLRKGHSSLVFDISLSATKIVSASHDKKVFVYDFGNGAEMSAMFG